MRVTPPVIIWISRLASADLFDMEKIERSLGVRFTRWLVFATSGYCLTLLAFSLAPHGLPRILFASEKEEAIRFIFGVSLVLLAISVVALFLAGETKQMKIFSATSFIIALLGAPVVYVSIAY